MPESTKNPVSFWKKTCDNNTITFYIADIIFYHFLRVGEIRHFPAQVIQIFLSKIFRLANMAGYHGDSYL